MWFILLSLPLFVGGTSIKMDFLSAGTVRWEERKLLKKNVGHKIISRTDPLDFTETGACLSDHVHR